MRSSTPGVDFLLPHSDSGSVLRYSVWQAAGPGELVDQRSFSSALTEGVPNVERHKEKKRHDVTVSGAEETSQI